MPLAQARPGGLGPSAIEAARLKDDPPPNFLSHYLPDDRYKIAGGVWKFVSTDLDTYYHVPSSPNMMRQPADRVIGFASIRDAEEAGYTADPTDGTAREAAMAEPSLSPGGAGTGLAKLNGNAEEERYSQKVEPLIRQSQRDGMQLLMSLMTAARSARQSGQAAAFPAAMRQTTAQSLSQSRNLIRRFDSVRPPRRLGHLHSLISQELHTSNNMIFGLNRIAVTGNVGYLMQLQNQARRGQALQTAINQEVARLRRQG